MLWLKKNVEIDQWIKLFVFNSNIKIQHSLIIFANFLLTAIDFIIINYVNDILRCIFFVTYGVNVSGWAVYKKNLKKIEKFSYWHKVLVILLQKGYYVGYFHIFQIKDFSNLWSRVKKKSPNCHEQKYHAHNLALIGRKKNKL